MRQKIKKIDYVRAMIEFVLLAFFAGMFGALTYVFFKEIVSLATMIFG